MSPAREVVMIAPMAAAVYFEDESMAGTMRQDAPLYRMLDAVTVYAAEQGL